MFLKEIVFIFMYWNLFKIIKNIDVYYIIILFNFVMFIGELVWLEDMNFIKMRLMCIVSFRKV